MDSIDELLNRVSTLPPAPKLLPQLLAALSDVEADTGRVVDLITYDPALTAKVLRVCNSAYFALASRVSTIADAVHLLGFYRIYMIVATTSSQDFLKATPHSALDPDEMWRHLVCSAFAAQSIGKRIGADGNILFTAGLLHDIGKVPLADVLQGDYDQLLTDGSVFGRQLGALESASFGVNHAEVGARLLENWSFAPEFVEAVHYHHDPAAAGDGARLAACVELADLVAHSMDTEGEASFAEAEQPLAIVGMSPADLGKQREWLNGKLDAIDAMCA